MRETTIINRLAATSSALESRLAAFRELDAAAQRDGGPPAPDRDAEVARLRGLILKQAGAIQKVLRNSGVDLNRMMRRADNGVSGGQGGPFAPMLRLPSRLKALPAAPHPQIDADLERLRALNALLHAMPLTAPLDGYVLTSPFGVRIDPLNGRQALHEGIDLGGPRGARVAATAPGVVVAAERSRAYGIMVEIDHGMGIHTRYAHLRRALVHPGEQVALHDAIGIMGSTGRSTGEHVHYEVRVDGEPYDPASFIEAGVALETALGD